MATQADFAELLQKSQQRNLKLKTKIIELENDLNHERVRAKEYQDKFRDAVLQSQASESQDLLEKLNLKENQLNDCRMQIIELNRRMAFASSSPSHSDIIALARENEQLMSNIEQIKNAAISAIMAKEEQLEQLGKTISRYQLMETELKDQYDKYDSLEREFDLTLKEKQLEIDELNEKIIREREGFFSRLEFIQKEANQEESIRDSLLEKAQDLQGNLEKSQMVIADYENKVAQLQNHIAQQRINFQHTKAKHNIETEDLKQSIKIYEKEMKNLAKTVEQLKQQQKKGKEAISRLNELNSQLTHKLTIKKKKQNKAIKDKITSSFSGMTKPNPVYASFAIRPNKDSIYQDEPKHLGSIPEIQDLGSMIENINFQDMKEEEEKKEAPISSLMLKKKDKSAEVVQAKTDKNTSNHSQNTNNEHLTKQIQSLKQSLLRIQTEKKELQLSLSDLYSQMQKLNESLMSLTNDLQLERKTSSQLRQQFKKTKKESELIVEVQSLTLHVQKLENDMIASKLKYAQEADHIRQKYNREKLAWTQKLVQLTEKIAKQDLQISQKQSKTEQKKKKKGFFG